MCRRMTVHLAIETKYRGKDQHVGAVLAYVRDGRWMRWQEDDLRDVCLFVETLLEDDEYANEIHLLVKLAKQGRKKFPQDPLFPFILGRLEMERGPYECNRRLAKECFEQVRQWAKTSPYPADARLAEKAEEELHLLDTAPPMVLSPDPRDFGFADEDLDLDDDFDPDGGMDPAEFREQLVDMIERMAKKMGIDPRLARKELEKHGLPLPLPPVRGHVKNKPPRS